MVCAAQRLGQRVGQRPVGFWPDPERAGDQRHERASEALGVSEVHDPGTVGIVRLRLERASLSASLVLPIPPGPHNVSSAHPAEHRDQVGQVTLPADERIRLGWQVSCPGAPSGCGRFES